MSGTEENFAAEVLVSGVPYSLSYSLLGDHSAVEVGSEVTVELGRRQAKGWVVKKLGLNEALEEISKRQAAKDEAAKDCRQLGFFAAGAPAKQNLKSIFASAPGFLPEQLPLFRWMAEYYGVSLVDVIENAVPRRQVSQRSALFAELTAEGAEKWDNDIDWREKLRKRSPLQYKMFELLGSSNNALPFQQLVALGKSARALLTKLRKTGMIEVFDETSLEHLFPTTEFPERVMDTPPELTEQQAAAMKAIEPLLSAKTFSPVLLFGVTGSGKTEVYLRAIQQVLDEGGSALVIVPEIALTPQLFDRFESRLKVPLAVLHSQVGPTARWRAWQAMLEGKIRVALGARSAVFAPLKDLRLIIVDEEHESSYKQSDMLRYHARDVAVMRAKFSEAAILLGSATPSFESLINVKKGRYQLVQLPDRVSSRPMPVIEIVDLNKIKRRDMPSENITPALHDAIEETLSRSGQVIILYNRRGFSTFLQCSTCNEVLTCPHCSVTMTFHLKKNRVLCHYCGETFVQPKFCSHCRDPKTSRVEGAEGETNKEAEAMGLLVPRGAGTEKVVDELARLFPGARIVRLDRDTTSRKESYRTILGSMRSGEADILVGTQMIAKGHDLPGVTLVGIIDADVGLHSPDFRASEKSYQLITQASGRAGRGSEPGRVFIQTREPNHPSIVATLTGRFTAFARYELEYRRKLNYPPWGKLLRLISSCPDQHDAMQSAIATRAAVDALVKYLKEEIVSSEDGEPVSPDVISVLGPAPAPHEKLRGRYRWHILVKASSARSLSRLAGQLNAWRSSVKEFPDFRLAIDIDPYDML